MRASTLIASAVAAGALLVPAATAKEGVRAILDDPVRIGTPSGKTIVVEWHLEDGEGRPFGGGGIYLRVSRCRGPVMRVTATERGMGSYTARLRVPRGGIRKLMVGLPGWRTTADGVTTRADAVFNFVPALGRRCP